MAHCVTTATVYMHNRGGGSSSRMVRLLIRRPHSAKILLTYLNCQEGGLSMKMRMQSIPAGGEDASIVQESYIVSNLVKHLRFCAAPFEY